MNICEKINTTIRNIVLPFQSGHLHAAETGEVCTQCEADMLASLKRWGLVTFERSFFKGNYFSLLSRTQLFSFQTFRRHSDFGIITIVHSINCEKD